MSEQATSDFETAAWDQSRGGLLGDVWAFFRYNKKWWLLPIVVALMLLGALVVLSGSAAAPFIYTLF
jgi:Family of unknown function (DUF5989)